MEAVRFYVDDQLGTPDAVLRQEGGSIFIAFSHNRPVCPYHGRVHDHENMVVRLSNSKDGVALMLFCLRERQGEVKHASRIVIDVRQDDRSRVQVIRDRVRALVDEPMTDALTVH